MEKIEQALWGIADNLRSSDLPTKDYTSYLLPLITLKILNENQDHPYSIPWSATWSTISSYTSTIGRKIDYALEELEHENRDLKDVFTTTSFSKLPDNILITILSKLSSISLSRQLFEDPNPLTGTLAQSIDEFVARFDVHGEFSTPPEIANLLVNLLDISKGTVYDAASGLGGFLIESAKHAGPDKVQLFGQEINRRTWAVGRLNLILHGLYQAMLQVGHTIREPKWIKSGQLHKFDYVLTNPPFAVKNWGHEITEHDPYNRFYYGIPSASYGDLAFVLHSIASLRENGRAAFLLPIGVLARGGADSMIRKALLKEDLIESVISLPSNLFAGTGISVCVVLINKMKPSFRVGYVQLIRAEEGFLYGRTQNKLREQDIRKILEAYRSDHQMEGYSKFVSSKRIYEEDGILTPLYYMERVEVESKTGKHWVNIGMYEQSSLPKQRLCDVADVFRGMSPKKDREHQDAYHQKFFFVNLADVQDESILLDDLEPVFLNERDQPWKYELQPNDLLLSNKGNIKMAVVPNTTKQLIASNNFIVIRSKRDLIDIRFVKNFLQSPIGMKYLHSKQRGTAMIVISMRDVEDILLPVLPLEQQLLLSEMFHRAEQEMQQKIKQAEEEFRIQYHRLYKEMGLTESFE